MDDAASPKSFGDAAAYDTEIRCLVPGYDALHETLGHVLPCIVHDNARVLFVGSGTGHEVVALARARPRCALIDAIDPEPAMVQATKRAVGEAALTCPIGVREGTLATADGRYDVVIASLVGHLIPDDGQRGAFFGHLARALEPSGVAVIVDLMDVGPIQPLVREAHLRWAEHAGLSPARLSAMRDRLSHGFAMLTHARMQTLLTAHRLTVHAEFFRVLGVVGSLVKPEGNAHSSRQYTRLRADAQD